MTPPRTPLPVHQHAHAWGHGRSATQVARDTATMGDRHDLDLTGSARCRDHRSGPTSGPTFRTETRHALGRLETANVSCSFRSARHSSSGPEVPKLKVAGSNPVSRSKIREKFQRLAAAFVHLSARDLQNDLRNPTRNRRRDRRPSRSRSASSRRRAHRFP